LQQQQTLQRFEKLARKTFAKLEESAFKDRAQAHAEFKDEIEELKSEMLLLKKDAADEVWREGQELVDKGKEACAQFSEDINYHLSRTLNKIDATVGRNRLRKLVAREMRRLRTGRKKAVPKRRTVSMSNISKSKEKKGERGKHGLPGERWAVVEEWEDV
jgi:gas vesicle protein